MDECFSTGEVIGAFLRGGLRVRETAVTDESPVLPARLHRDECGDSSPERGPSAKERRRVVTEKRLRGELERRDAWGDPQIHSDPANTLFVCGLPEGTTQQDVWRWGDRFGRVASCRVVRKRTRKDQRGEDGGPADTLAGDKRRTGRSPKAGRDYAFVEFSSRGEMLKALREGDDTKLNGLRVHCEEERGRTESSFVPRRFRDLRPQGNADLTGEVPQNGPSAGRAAVINDELTDFLDTF
jgi:RNA recognition motif-containing protein